MDQKKIGMFIRECRNDVNLTQEELASKLGVNNRTISRWENGNNMPDYALLNDLCNILHININELLIGEKISKTEIVKVTDENLNNILKEYYKMKKQKKILKTCLLVLAAILITIIIKLIIALGFVSLMALSTEKEVTTDINDYNKVFGTNAVEKYQSKWDMDEEIFPKSVENLNVKDFKMYYYNPWDKEFLSYLVVDYDDNTYQEEVNRLTNLGIEEYQGIYSVTGFSKYNLVAMNSDSYLGFIYALNDDTNKRIIYVEMIFCNYVLDIDYEKEINPDYLPDNFNAKMDNPYSKEMEKKNKLF